MRARTIWCTTLLLLCHHLLWPQAVTRQLPAPEAAQADPQNQSAPQSEDANAAPVASPAQTTAKQQPASQPDQAQTPFTLPGGVDPGADPAFAPPPDPSATQPAPDRREAQEPAPATPFDDEPGPAQTPGEDPATAHPVAAPPAGKPVHIEADTQRKAGDLYTLDGHVLIDYEQYTIHADHATYNAATAQVDAQGHVTVDGGPSDEHMVADHGTMNLDAHTAHYYTVTGTIGLHAITHERYVFTAPNPFSVSGDEVLQLGPGIYQVIRGSMTSCRLPNPDWRLLSHTILIDNGKATARNSIFTLRFFTLQNVPMLYLPYVTHPLAKDQRQSGFLLPIFGNDTTKGLIVGEQVYFALSPSADLTVGAQYFSRRGFAPQGQFRYRGAGEDFGFVRLRSLLDRLPGAANEGGADIIADGRRAIDPNTRAVADVEYLSSYIYRQAFEENYSASINSQVRSQAYLIHEQDGLVEAGRFERYQTFRSDNPGDEIRILHTPELDLEALDRPLGGTRVLWGGAAAAAAMSRSEPGFQTTSVIPRIDLYPHLALPLSAGGWTLRSEAGLRETYYGRSQNPGPLGSVPTQRDASLNRTAFTSEISLRPPTVERDFDAPFLRRRLGGDLRHTIEPEFRYRFVTGINNYSSVLRFDQVDTLANTNELEYGLTQHLFLRHLHSRPCKDDEALGPDETCGGGTLDWITWTVAQKYFFDKTFGGALVTGARNVLDTTLDLSGVAFLVRPRDASPVISRLRLNSRSPINFQWDVDYDARRSRLLSSNASIDYRAGQVFFSAGNYRLHTLGANASDGIAATPSTATSAVSDFNQLRLAAIYGSPVRHGLSAGFNMGYDLHTGETQYASAEVGYNRDCCGLTFEMRRYSLGSVRDDTQYLFSFTLASVGTAGNLNHMVRVF